MYQIKLLLIQLTPFFSLLFGLVFGSFLNVCIYRIPLGRPKGLAAFESESDDDNIVDNKDSDGQKIRFFFPRRSICPNCKNTLTWLMNIPVFSWLFLRGRCHFCKERISWRYPLVELLSGLFCYLSFTNFPPLTATIVFFFCAAMIVISFIDLEYYIIPNVITYPGMFIAALLALYNNFQPIVDFPLVKLEQAGWGLLVGGGFLWLVSATYTLVRKKEGLGFGDVKLMALVGLLFGPQAAIIGIFLGSTLGTIIGVLYIALTRATFSRPLPFGPFLAAGSLTYIFASALMDSFILPFFKI